MKKRIHILTVRDHYKLMVEPDAQWYKESWSGKYSERFRPRHIAGTVPDSTSYNFGVDCDYEAIAYFLSYEAASKWMADENAKYPPPPKPKPPPPPLPIGTYYMLEARYYEIRQITRQTKSGVQIFLGNEWEKPYRLVSGHGNWQEKFVAKYDDRAEALAHLHKLIRRVTKK